VDEELASVLRDIKALKGAKLFNTPATTENIRSRRAM
jgi:hypothetical protein